MKGECSIKRCKLTFRILLTTILILTTSPVLINAQTFFDRTNVPGKLAITASAANIRSGPGTSFLKVGLVYKGQVIDCLGKLGGWWVVHLPNDVVGHTSPTYGSPFDMMKTFGISYTSAGENIAGNSSVDAAHTALMNDPPHKANILNSSFNYVGIGITLSPTYGKVFVQDFIGR